MIYRLHDMSSFEKAVEICFTSACFWTTFNELSTMVSDVIQGGSKSKTQWTVYDIR